jgi:hypothetical protein
MSTRLSQKIIDAHKKRDNWLLVELYTQAADSSADCDTECFFSNICPYIFAGAKPSKPIQFEKKTGAQWPRVMHIHPRTVNFQY